MIERYFQDELGDINSLPADSKRVGGGSIIGGAELNGLLMHDDFVPPSVGTTTISGTIGSRAYGAYVDDTTMAFCFRNSSGHPTVSLLTLSGGTVTANTEYVIEASSMNVNGIFYIDATHLLVIWNQNKAAVLTHNGTTITAEGTNATGLSMGNGGVHEQIPGERWVAVHDNSGQARFQAISVSGTTVTIHSQSADIATSESRKMRVERLADNRMALHTINTSTGNSSNRVRMIEFDPTNNTFQAATTGGKSAENWGTGSNQPNFAYHEGEHGESAAWTDDDGVNYAAFGNGLESTGNKGQTCFIAVVQYIAATDEIKLLTPSVAGTNTQQHFGTGILSASAHQGEGFFGQHISIKQCRGGPADNRARRGGAIFVKTTSTGFNQHGARTMAFGNKGLVLTSPHGLEALNRGASGSGESLRACATHWSSDFKSGILVGLNGSSSWRVYPMGDPTA